MVEPDEMINVSIAIDTIIPEETKTINEEEEEESD